MFWKTLSLLMTGAALGMGFLLLTARIGLTSKEWGYLRDFYQALRNGAYSELGKEDKNENGPDDA